MKTPQKQVKTNSNNCQIPLYTKGVSCRYPNQKIYAIKDINITVDRASIIGILGPNGAGKSTFLKSALDLQPSEGTIRFFGQTFSEAKHRVAYIPQRSSIDWDFPVSALDVCLMGIYPRIGWLKRITKAHKEEAMSYLERVQLQDFAHRQVGALSGGQQQRVFMARALAQKADLFLLDEPMAGIDQKTQDLLFSLFKNLTKEKKTLIIIHHNLQAVQEHFDHAILINHQVIAQGHPQNVLSSENIHKAYSAVIS